jgi:hypothetical protein
MNPLVRVVLSEITQDTSESDPVFFAGTNGRYFRDDKRQLCEGL